MSPCEGLYAFERRPVAILADERQHLRAAWRHPKPKSDARGFAGRNFHAMPQRQDRIEHRTHRVGQRPGIDDRDGIAQVNPTPHKASSIGLELQGSNGFALKRAGEGDPYFRFAGIPGPAGGEQGAALGNEIGQHEQLGKRGMGGIRRGRGQHHFRVRRQFDFPRPVSLIGHRDPADFSVILGRHQDLGRGEDGSVAAGDFRAIFEKCCIIAVGFTSDRLISGRPYPAVGGVAQEDVVAEGVASRIFTPPGHCEIPPAAVAGAGRSQHDGIISVRQ